MLREHMQRVDSLTANVPKMEHRFWVVYVSCHVIFIILGMRISSSMNSTVFHLKIFHFEFTIMWVPKRFLQFAICHILSYHHLIVSRCRRLKYTAKVFAINED